MTARETLESFGGLVDQLDRFQSELALCRIHAQEDTRSPERWQRRIRALQADIRRHRRLCRSRQGEIERLLSTLPDETMRTVLALRYLNLFSYAEISEVLHFSLRHIYRIHQQAAARLQAMPPQAG